MKKLNRIRSLILKELSIKNSLETIDTLTESSTIRVSPALWFRTKDDMPALLWSNEFIEQFEKRIGKEFKALVRMTLSDMREELRGDLNRVREEMSGLLK